MALRLTGRARLRVLVIAAVVIGGLSVFLWARSHQSHPAPNREDQSTSSASVTPSPVAAISPVLEATPTPTPMASATLSPDQNPGLPGASPTSSPDAALPGSFVGTLKLIIPVAGVRPDQLLDTFADARSEGRVHDAIDIPAAAGTPVLAAADGEIVRLFQSERGGTTIYQLSADKKLVFYYAHLQGYAEGLAAGKFVKQGEVIGYVGDTGNAGPGNYHLHFSIAVLTDPKRYFEGTNINPYPLLRK